MTENWEELAELDFPGKWLLKCCLCVCAVVSLDLLPFKM